MDGTARDLLDHDSGAGSGGGAKIGPNALLQLVPVLDRVGGTELRGHLFASGGVFELPDGSAMIDEMPVARVHQAMRRELADLAPTLAWAAGKRTGDYILVNRIPRAAQYLLHLLPTRLAVPMLTRAIARHAWTFAGSGRFSVKGGAMPVFEIADNPMVRGEFGPHPVCHWHAAVFERLFTRLIDPAFRCEETACCAAGAPACRFEMRLIAPAP
jgi:divinyl protochlorophyllide a 8-vinyl-reductase